MIRGRGVGTAACSDYPLNLDLPDLTADNGSDPVIDRINFKGWSFRINLLRLSLDCFVSKDRTRNVIPHKKGSVRGKRQSPGVLGHIFYCFSLTERRKR